MAQSHHRIKKCERNGTERNGTLRRMAPPTLNDLQQHQHEKDSLVFVPAQSPSGLALVACALSAVDLRVKVADCDVESHRGNPYKTMVRRLPKRSQTTNPRCPGSPRRRQERQTTHASGCGYNRIRLDLSTLLGHDM